MLAIKAEGRWGQPIAWFQASKEVTAAAQVLADQQGKASGLSETALRTQQVTTHNHHVEEVARQRKQVGQTIEQGKTWLTAGRNLQAQLDLLEQAFSRYGWVSSTTAAVLDKILQQLIRRDVLAALQVASTLLFQTMPAPAQIAQWVAETERLLEQARSEEGVGFTALASFRSIVSDVTELVLAGCTSPVQRAVQQDPDPVDRWYHLAHQLTQPGHVVHWVQWALYWAGFPRTCH
ncbi:hypothetical protein ABH905_005271 [Pseudomonas frederiksbergensis]|uniref:hypothetical protein n=1 Tax=Pseudomonas frederiksbergensis TaxID=104087 RepID=UPI003D19E2C3